MINNSQFSILNIQQRPRFCGQAVNPAGSEFANSSARKGFTLIETMVALSILLISVVGPMSLIGNSLHNIYFARDQMVAINLAQEGVEVVRQMRDSNLLAGVPTPWDTGLGDGDYLVDAPSLSLTPAGLDRKIYQDATTGFYHQGSVFTTATQFSRTVTISVGTDERKVTSIVTWNTGNEAGAITVTEYLFNLTP